MSIGFKMKFDTVSESIALLGNCRLILAISNSSRLT